MFIFWLCILFSVLILAEMAFHTKDEERQLRRFLHGNIILLLEDYSLCKKKIEYFLDVSQKSN